MRIDVIVYDGFDELDAFGPYEVFGHARTAGADLDVAYAALDRDPGDVVTASLATSVLVQRRADGDADLTVVPGGGWHGDGPGARAEVERGEVPALLAERSRAGHLVAGVCTGGMLLASAGLLRGRRATTHHTALDDLATYGATVVRERVVDDGNVLTAGGVTSGIDLALHLVERLCGPERADWTAQNMEHRRVRAGEPSVTSWPPSDPAR